MTTDTSLWVEYLVNTEGRTQQQQQQQKHVHRPPWLATLDSAYCELEGIFFFSFTISEVYSIRSLR